jgi:hypothetical protein
MGMGMGQWDKILTKGGNRAGSAVGAATGAVQLIKAKANKKRAMEATPEGVDPQQSAFLAELQQKKNALNVGSEYSSSIDAINDKMSQSQDVLAGNSGGDTGSTISALLKAQQVANQGEGQVLAQGQQMEGMYTGLYGDLLNKVVQRKLELGLLDRAQNMAEWAQNKQSGASNFLAGAQSFLDWKGGDKKAQNPIGGSGMAATAENTGASPFGSARTGVEGFKLGTQNQTLGANKLNLGSTNPLGNMKAGTAAKSGINLSSLKDKFSAAGGSGGGSGFSQMLSGFGK